ncbi:MAG: hypothetical protein IK055_07015 [Lachnospiraceae bacterium]|nr:hypothetical protein [Lachnospiraceae bacterium]
MPFFRELPAKLILLLHLLLGVLTGWFFVQGFRLVLGMCRLGEIPLTGLFYRVLGVQLAFLQFIIVWIVDKRVWEKKRVAQPKSPATSREIGLLFASIALYGVGCGLINLIRLL